MCEDRLVSLNEVRETVQILEWRRWTEDGMEKGATTETGWYKAKELFDAIDSVPEAERVKPTECMSLEPENVVHHRAICNELNSLYERKNRDYGDSFHKTYLEEGMAMARIRLTDKLERFKKLTREGGQEVKDESIRDTLIDMANYAIMTAMEMDREAEE